MKQELIQSKKRIAEFGEVYTPKWIVDNMLNLLPKEIWNETDLYKRFLEPSCGTGNFLLEILERKLKTLTRICNGDIKIYEKKSMLVIASIYGIDILYDNVLKTRERLFNCFKHYYFGFNNRINQKPFLEGINYLLEKNILHGNAITMVKVDENMNDTSTQIEFCEWNMRDNNILMKVHVYEDLILQSKFGIEDNVDWESDHNAAHYLSIGSLE